MTVSQLYQVYRRAYLDYDRTLGGPSHSWVSLVGSPIERAIAEFAVEDAANGISLRSGEQFARAIEVGLAALGPLGLVAA
jgi:hypothetical protein